MFKIYNFNQYFNLILKVNLSNLYFYFIYYLQNYDEMIIIFIRKHYQIIYLIY